MTDTNTLHLMGKTYAPGQILRAYNTNPLEKPGAAMEHTRSEAEVEARNSLRDKADEIKWDEMRTGDSVLLEIHKNGQAFEVLQKLGARYYIFTCLVPKS
jgi:hypothetical protein